jgi:hypothetical protein
MSTNVVIRPHEYVASGKENFLRNAQSIDLSLLRYLRHCGRAVLFHIRVFHNAIIYFSSPKYWPSIPTFDSYQHDDPEGHPLPKLVDLRDWFIGGISDCSQHGRICPRTNHPAAICENALIIGSPAPIAVPAHV